MQIDNDLNAITLNPPLASSYSPFLRLLACASLEMTLQSRHWAGRACRGSVVPRSSFRCLFFFFCCFFTLLVSLCPNNQSSHTEVQGCLDHLQQFPPSNLFSFSQSVSYFLECVILYTFVLHVPQLEKRQSESRNFLVTCISQPSVYRGV